MKTTYCISSYPRIAVLIGSVHYEIFLPLQEYLTWCAEVSLAGGQLRKSSLIKAIWDLKLGIETNVCEVTEWFTLKEAPSRYWKDLLIAAFNPFTFLTFDAFSIRDQSQPCELWSILVLSKEMEEFHLAFLIDRFLKNSTAQDSTTHPNVSLYTFYVSSIAITCKHHCCEEILGQKKAKLQWGNCQ